MRRTGLKVIEEDISFFRFSSLDGSPTSRVCIEEKVALAATLVPAEDRFYP